MDSVGPGARAGDDLPGPPDDPDRRPPTEVSFDFSQWEGQTVRLRFAVARTSAAARRRRQHPVRTNPALSAMPLGLPLRGVDQRSGDESAYHGADHRCRRSRSSGGVLPRRAGTSYAWRCRKEFEYGAVAFFDLQDGLKLALWPRASLAHDAGIAVTPRSASEFTIGHNVRTREEVDAVLARAQRAGARIVKNGTEMPWGGYAGYFEDPDGHLWDVVWNPQLLPEDRCHRGLRSCGRGFLAAEFRRRSTCRRGGGGWRRPHDRPHREWVRESTGAWRRAAMGR